MVLFIEIYIIAQVLVLLLEIEVANQNLWAAAAHWPEVLTVLRRVLESMVDFYLLYHVLQFWVSLGRLENLSPELAAQNLFAQRTFAH
jgi:hypothetical protein